MAGNIVFDAEKRERLRKAYNAAVDNGDIQFVFEGHDILTAYAKFLVEHLDNVIGDET